MMMKDTLPKNTLPKNTLPNMTCEEDHTDDEEEYFAKWHELQERTHMAKTAYEEHSDGEDMPDLVGSEDESNDSKAEQAIAS